MACAARGVKPPRIQSLHESFAGVLLFQQVSLASVVAMLRRLVLGLTRPVDVDGVTLDPFPSAEAIADCSEADLRRFGMSGAKASALWSASARRPRGRLSWKRSATPAGCSTAASSSTGSRARERGRSRRDPRGYFTACSIRSATSGSTRCTSASSITASRWFHWSYAGAARWSAKK
jgi:hypothetical protein